jgi:aspartate aminotransferase
MSAPALSERARIAPPSPIRKLVPFADEARRRGLNVYGLNIGQPDIETPQALMDAVRRSDVRVLAYTPSQGTAEYRAALVEYYARHGIRLSSDEILVTTAGSEAILFAFACATNPGEEVLIPEPMYANYLGFAAMLGTTVVPISCVPEEGYHLPPTAAIEARITPRTKAILYCNPGNPTGTVYTPDEVDGLARLVKEHDLFLVADEVYREFVYEGDPPRSVLQIPGLEDRAIMVDSISKRVSACGARIGCVAARNKDLLAAALKFAQARLSPPTFGQILGQAATRLPDSYFAGVVDEYRRRRDAVHEALAAMPGVVCHKPTGAFYLMARFPVDDAEAFAVWLLTHFQIDGETTFIAPGNGFYASPGAGRQEARIACVLGVEKLRKAMRIVAEGLAAYPGRIG